MIDTSMYNRDPNVPDISKVFDTYNQQRTIQDMAQLRKMELAQAKEAEAGRKQEAAKQRTLKGLLEVNTNVGPDGRISIDPRFASDAARLGMVKEGMAFQEEQANKERERFGKLLEARKNVLSKVRPGNLQDYDTALKSLKAFGDDLDGIPNRLQFISDPESLNMHFQEVLSEKEKWDRQIKEKELANTSARDAETARKNKAAEEETKRNNNLQAKLARERIAAEAGKRSANPEAGLPQDAKTQINVLATKTAGKKAILNQLKSDRAQLFSALGLDPSGRPIPGAKRDEELAYRYGQSMLKTMNSKEGADAVGVDEARRSGDALEYNIFDVKAGLGMKPGKLIGRDIDGFAAQVGALVDGIEASVNANQGEINRIYGRQQEPPAQLPGGGTFLKPNPDGSFDYVPGGQ